MAYKSLFRPVLFVLLAGCGGCAQLEQLGATLGVSPATQPAPESGGPLSNAAAGTPEALDRTSDAERQAAARQTPAGRALGRTVASLGSPAEAGFWLKTPLVTVETPGQVRDPATGRTVSLRLIPIEGPATAGSRMSLAAMRVLEVRLTDLVTVEVSA